MRAMHAAGFANIPTSQRADDGLTLTDAYIAAAVRCAPPDNKPTPDEIAACHPHLVAEVAALAAHAGDRRARADRASTRPGGCSPIAASSSGRSRRSATAASTEPRGGPIVIASYHPSRQNTNTRQADAADAADRAVYWRTARWRAGEVR